MKDKILNLRKKGKTYQQIADILNCSKSTVCYYCGEGQKKKQLDRQKKRRSNNRLISKVGIYKRSLQIRTRAFNKKALDGKVDKNLPQTFTYKDVLLKFGVNTHCYLTGKPINLLYDKYELDHIIPRTRGGNNSIENLGILSTEANQAKRNMLNSEFLDFCKSVLKFNGYNITQIKYNG